MRSPKPLWPRTQDLDARQRTESQAARKGLVSGPAGGRDVSGAPASAATSDGGCSTLATLAATITN